ncbi:hypothetical protein VaNZ11_000726 [Volvox africanus]|uniref:J domain-containing protein n=1 Tax=Volvox africanus TaxID=51714 RepID=A0ABQ5RN07_9CHLO|nr:hypothetical protein VaNZ11_000726 [Volvox africanus]
MSAASKKNDPFHFDEIYKQAGVEDLFVKKTMGELKQKQASAQMPSSSPVRPAPAATAPRPAPSPSNFDLDFLATIAGQGGTPPGPSKQNSSSSLAGPALQPQQQEVPKQAAAVKAREDPFALFEEVPGAAPPQKHIPPKVPAAPSPTDTGILLDFEASHVSAQPTHPPPRAPLQYQPLSSAISSGSSVQPLPQPPPPPYSDHLEHRVAPPGPVSVIPSLATVEAGTAGASAVPPPVPSFAGDNLNGRLGSAPLPATGATVVTASTEYSSQDFVHLHSQQQTLPQQSQAAPLSQHSQQEYHHIPEGPDFSQHSNSSSTLTWSHTPSGSGLSGYLKAFGKKAVRVAKAGLAQLEHALEGLDQQQQPQQQPQQYSHSSMRAPSSFGTSRGTSDTDGDGVSNDEALAWAVRLADLPPHAQQQELSHMAPPLRRKVIVILREQVRSEHEAAGGAAPGAVTSSGLGHGGHNGSSPVAAAGAPPPYGHGSPLPQRGSGSQDVMSLGLQPGGPRDRATHVPGSNVSQQPSPPLAYEDASQYTAAPARPVQPQPSQAAPLQPPPAADLLGLGSGEVLSNAAVLPVSSSEPVVDDLLGFGDRAPETHVVTPAAAPFPVAQPPGSKPPHSPQANSAVAGPAPAVAAVPAAPPPPPPAVVHIDDMDDFFSGGKAAAPQSDNGGGGSGLAMHNSSSAPNLGVARSAGAVGSSSSAAALADMLHGSDDEGGAGGADVDVSGYADLYKGEQGSSDEPEVRRRLRAQREAAKHAKMKAALAEKLAKEAEEAARREEQVTLKDQYKANIELWKSKNKGNIRGLLGSLHTVLWPDSGWAPVSVGDLLEPMQVKRVYMRANLLVHPDKVRQRNGSADQVAIADMVFDVLKEGWNAFR